MSKKAKQRLDRVRKACKDFGIGTIALFRRAFKWTHGGGYDDHEVRTAHAAYQRKKLIPSWMRRFLDHVMGQGLRTLPA